MHDVLVFFERDQHYKDKSLGFLRKMAWKIHYTRVSSSREILNFETIILKVQKILNPVTVNTSEINPLTQSYFANIKEWWISKENLLWAADILLALMKLLNKYSNAKILQFTATEKH